MTKQLPEIPWEDDTLEDIPDEFIDEDGEVDWKALRKWEASLHPTWKEEYEAELKNR